MKKSQYASQASHPHQTWFAHKPFHFEEVMHEQMVSKRRAIVAICMIACIAIVAAISKYVLIGKSIRLDEAQSLWQASHSFGGMLHVVAFDVHVPLYHILLHAWITLFGTTIETARIMSVIFFMATIPVVYLLAREVLRTRWALFTMIMFSVAPFMNWYANEARMYSMLVFFGTLSQLFFLRLMRTNQGWFWYAIISVIGAYSHYFFLFNLASQAIFYFIMRKRFAPHTLKRFIGVALLVAIALSPWIYYFVSLGSASTTRPHLATPTSVDFFNVYSQFFFGFQSDKINTILLSAWPIVMLIGLAAVRRNVIIPDGLKFTATMAVLPAMLAYAISFISPFFLSRYIILSVAPLFVTVVWLFSLYRRHVAHALLIAIAIIMGISFVRQAYSPATPVREDYRGVAAAIETRATAKDVVVLSAPFTIYPFTYYYDGAAQVETLPIWNREEANSPIPAFSETLMESDTKKLSKDHHNLYLVLSQDQGYEEAVKQHYLHNFKLVHQEEFTAGLSLYVFQVGYNDVKPL